MRHDLLMWMCCTLLFLGVLACGGEETTGSFAPPVASEQETLGTETLRSIEEPVLRVKRFVSDSFHVDRKWGSMQGPVDVQRLSLAEFARPEILWVRGYRASVVPADGVGHVSQEFMCHNNLDFSAANHARIFEWKGDWARHAAVRDRVFTISQGQFDVVLPDGFGFPIRSDEPLHLTTQVLNHNIDAPDVHVRHEIEITYSRDRDLEMPLKPLFQHGIFVMASLDETSAYFGIEEPNETQEGSSCALGEHADVEHGVFMDELGRRFTGHWIVEPGRETRRTLVTRQLNLESDARIHFIGVHLHPFAETLELRDLSTGESLWTAHARGPDGETGLSEVDYYASEEGIPLFKDHEYELVSVYDNDSGVKQDAMATMFLYLDDPDAAASIEYQRRLRSWASEAD